MDDTSLTIGYGTYPFKGKECERGFSFAHQAGYRLFDTATMYDNFDAISQALKSINRETIYLSSKVWHDKQTCDGITKDISTTLKSLQTDYLDAYFLHWPNSNIPLEESFSTMKTLQDKGLIKHIGLSNINSHHLLKALKLDIPIAWVQVEAHPHFYDAELLKLCKQHNIRMQGWRPLNKGEVFSDPYILELSTKYKKNSAQIALRWSIENKIVPLPGSSSESHITQNIDVFDFSLTKEEIKTINDRAKVGKRYRLGAERGFGFSDEFDYTFDECWPSIT